ncbi:RNA-binding protein [Patescibacteria group bacterium]|jgi:cold-inducible RNA-binding protein|nr:RNA-binding protein [Patescibacteria group bacterium]
MADNARVFVGGIPYAATEEELKAHFGAAGTVVSVFLPIEKETGRKRGFGFVEFNTPDEQNKAIDMFNNTDLGGRMISVSAARPRNE